VSHHLGHTCDLALTPGCRRREVIAATTSSFRVRPPARLTLSAAALAFKTSVRICDIKATWVFRLLCLDKPLAGSENAAVFHSEAGMTHSAVKQVKRIESVSRHLGARPMSETVVDAIDWRTLEKVFLAAGFSLGLQSGPHRLYVKRGVSRPLVIPAEREIPPEIISSNLKIAGLSSKEYHRLLQEC
jgi:predicted RNA binding protein YcfA (HicA-like mRNA interferase family)